MQLCFVPSPLNEAEAQFLVPHRVGRLALGRTEPETRERERDGETEIYRERARGGLMGSGYRVLRKINAANNFRTFGQLNAKEEGTDVTCGQFCRRLL